MGRLVCTVGGCEKAAHHRGWCSAHYERWRRNGDPGAAGDARVRPVRSCSVGDCDLVARKRGFCENHYQLWRRHGRPERVRRRDLRNVAVNGYVRIWAPDHACANRDGYVFEHRQVWYDANGYIPIGFQIHHKNGERTDNRIENLELLSSSGHARQHARERGYITNQFGTWPLRPS